MDDIFIITADCRYCEAQERGTISDLTKNGWVLECVEEGREIGQCPECAVLMARGE